MHHLPVGHRPKGRARTRTETIHHTSPRASKTKNKNRRRRRVLAASRHHIIYCRPHTAHSFYLRLCLVVLCTQVCERVGLLYSLMSATKESVRKIRPPYRWMPKRRMRGGADRKRSRHDKQKRSVRRCLRWRHKNNKASSTEQKRILDCKRQTIINKSHNRRERAEPGATTSAFNSPARQSIIVAGKRARGVNERIVRTHFLLFATPARPHLRLAHPNKFCDVPLDPGLAKREQERLHSVVVAARRDTTKTTAREKKKKGKGFNTVHVSRGENAAISPRKTLGLARRL